MTFQKVLREEKDLSLKPLNKNAFVHMKESLKVKWNTMQWQPPPAHLLTWMISVYDPEYGLQVGSISINDFQQARLDVLKDNTVTLLLVSCFASCFGGRRRVLTSWLRCSMAKSSSQDLYSSMPSTVLRTSCGLSIRQGNPRCKTDSTAVAQLLSVILPVRKRESHGDLWEISSSKHIKAK